jgi:hypothetical protein
MIGLPPGVTITFSQSQGMPRSRLQMSAITLRSSGSPGVGP